MIKQASGIIGMGSYLPAKALMNADLERMMDTSDECFVRNDRLKATPNFPKFMVLATCQSPTWASTFCSHPITFC